MITSSYDVLSVENIYLLCSVICFLFQLYFLIVYGHKLLKISNIKIVKPISNDYPGVSIVICAKDEDINLESFLQNLLTQDYPDFEVIVVDDGSSDFSFHVLENYKSQYKNFSFSFIPVNAKLHSSKILGLTMAVRDARYDYLFFLDANCCPASKRWLQSMMQPVISNRNDVEIILGGKIPFYSPSYMNSLSLYNAICENLLVLGSAQHNSSFSGMGNAIIKKSFFQSVDGFKKIMYSKYANVDLFINKYANRNNIAVVFSKDSVVYEVSASSLSDVWVKYKQNIYNITNFSTKAIFILLRDQITKILLLMIPVFSLVFGTLNLLYLTSSLFVIFFLVHYIYINIISRKLMGKNPAGNIFLWNIVLPFFQLFTLLGIMITKKSRKI